MGGPGFHKPADFGGKHLAAIYHSPGQPRCRNSPNMDGFWIQDRIGAVQPVFYLDDISLQAGAPVPPGTNANVTIQLDALANRHAISPLIYGVAFASSSQLLDLNAPLHRSGGTGPPLTTGRIMPGTMRPTGTLKASPKAAAPPAATAMISSPPPKTAARRRC